ncbi:hypothetical protein [Streptomyces sp. NPDC058268]
MDDIDYEALGDGFWPAWQHQVDVLFGWPGWLDWVVLPVAAGWLGRGLLYRGYLALRGEHPNDCP